MRLSHESDGPVLSLNPLRVECAMTYLRRRLHSFLKTEPGQQHFLSRDEALAINPHYPRADQERTFTDQVVLTLRYWGFDDQPHRGQLVVHRAIAWRVKAGFGTLFAQRFPIRSMVPIVAYEWDDRRSMEADNTSGYNYRYIEGTPDLSRHARGLAIDLNPRENPVVYPDGRVYPEGARYDPCTPGTIVLQVVDLFRKLGADWGGYYRDFKDYHHFEWVLRP